MPKNVESCAIASMSDVWECYRLELNAVEDQIRQNLGSKVALGVTHDFIIGPRAARAQSRDGMLPTGTDLLMVQLAPWVGRLNLLLGVIILVLAAALTRSH